MLYIIATPIGNIEDITLRAMRILGEVNVLACEDTRRTRILYETHNIESPQKIISYRESNEIFSAQGIVKLLDEGMNVAVCSDAGYPGISDPGYRVIASAIEAGHEVVVIPGPDSILTALLKSGLPVSSFTFKGFPPRKSGQIKTFLELDKELPHTLIFFESPYRVEKFLEVALEVLGDRKCAVCMELTKKFERAYRGYISEMINGALDGKIKGEVVVVIAGKNEKFIREMKKEKDE